MLMIDSITLVDFISHRDTTIRFGDGVTVFIGRNGSGKSSVIDGITYALYGKHTRRNNSNLVRHGAHHSSLILEFSINGKRYKVEKRLSAKGTLESGVLYELSGGSWKMLAAGERKQFGESMSNEIAKILGLDYDKMRVAAVIQQGEIDRIIEYKPKEFKELINNIIGIDRLDNAYELMRYVIDGFRERLRSVYGYDDNSRDTLARDVERYEKDVEEMRRMISRIEEDVRRVVEEKVTLEKEYEEMRGKRERFEGLKVRVSNLLNYIGERKRSLEREVEEIKATISKAEECMMFVEQEEKVKASLDSAEEKVNRLDEEISRYKQEHTRLESLKRLVADKMTLLSNAREQLSTVERLKHVPDELSKVKERLQEVSYRISSSNEEMGRLKGLMECASKIEFKDGICPVCNSKVERINPLFDKNELKRRIQDAARELDILKREYLKLENRLKELEGYNEQLHMAKGFLEMNKIASINSIYALEEEVNSLSREVNSINTIKSKINSLVVERNDAYDMMKEYRRRLDEINKARAFLDAKSIKNRDDLERLRREVREREGLVGRLKIFLDKDAQTIALSMISPSPAYNIDEYAIDEYSKRLVGEIVTLAGECKGFSEERYMKIERRLKEVERVEREREKELAGLKSRLDAITNDLERLRGTLKVLDHAYNHTTMLERIREKAFHRNSIVARSLRSWALQHISDKASEYAKAFSIDISRIELVEEEGNNEVNIACYGRRGLIDLASMSGGEKVAIALALRFAIAYVMGGYRLDFVIMDEPTVHLDEERRASIVELIGLLAEGSALKQIIIITHDSEIFEDADVDHLYKFEMTDQGTVVSEVK
ncbi:putative SMC domain-containing protein, exonuclease SbcC [Candidatus Nitrosocaldus cavascurensis]|uniref:Putative SMC domain-containing protein, exonuclease SbcC n=2 Tax=Candidatus Nitrosocaldaceae TaxID=1968910 RepID=A0A2K5AS14_9ARCH|nr:putative SMC domain-containing protein, exonuclease SbcC [Candidatus Nitrosocaldus cavascurensis]